MEKIICSGPVIIENNKVLLIKEKKPTGLTPWFFPGGKVKIGENLKQACIRETKEEIGVEVKIIKQLETLKDYGYDQAGDEVTLFHYLSKRTGEIKPGPTLAEWGWHDINKLPDDCADNVKTIINNYLKNL